MENAYKIFDVIKELKNNHTGCYYDKVCDVAERKYGFENSTTDNYLDFLYQRWLHYTRKQ